MNSTSATEQLIAMVLDWAEEPARRDWYMEMPGEEARKLYDFAQAASVEMAANAAPKPDRRPEVSEILRKLERCARWTNKIVVEDEDGSELDGELLVKRLTELLETT